jgi:helicase
VIAESMGWEKKINKDLNKIRILSNRLVGGVQEEGLTLALLYIPGLSRYHIRRLMGAGYGDENSLRDASEVELDKLLPRRLVQRILERMKEKDIHKKMAKEKWMVQDENCKPEFAILPSPLKTTSITSVSNNLKPVSASSPSKTENCKPTFVTILEISQLRPDRIIFMGKEAKITARGFTLLYFLAQHKQEVVSYNSILDEIWKDNEDAIYTRIISYIYKFRKNFLDTIGHNKDNKEKVKDIFKVISGRGVMLNINDEELQIINP